MFMVCCTRAANFCLIKVFILTGQIDVDIAFSLLVKQRNRDCQGVRDMKRTLDTDSSEGPLGPWKKMMSQKHSKEYWYNESTKQSVWEDPYAAAVPHASAAASASAAPLASKKIKFQSGETDGIKVAESVAASARKWSKGYSERYKKDYWFDEVTGERSWEDPTAKDSSKPAEDSASSMVLVSDATVIELTKLVLTDPADIERELERERRAVAVDAPDCPREIATADLAHIVNRLRSESAVVVTNNAPKAEFPVIFRLADDDTAMITRAVQEDQILKTRLKVQLREGVADLPSFWDVWQRDADFRRIISTAEDPNEMKWTCQKTHNYKIATTFMPGYAKALYEHFNAKSVLDPCAGWGDRLVGAASSSLVERYVAFDPNSTLRSGYAALMKLYGHSVTKLSAQGLVFSNSFEVRTQPFEVGALALESNSFDLVFTSPPFFDYEMYNPNNPQYVDWIEQFYKPLFIQACRCVKPGHHFGIHIGKYVLI